MLGLARENALRVALGDAYAGQLGHATLPGRQRPSVVALYERAHVGGDGRLQFLGHPNTVSVA